MCGVLNQFCLRVILLILSLLLVIVQDKLGFTFMRNINELFERFKKFCVMIETHFSVKIKILRLDSGEKYVSHVLQSFLQEKGIVHQKSYPYTPKHNGATEKKNRHFEDY
jgi:transposase InsO family protein